MKPITQEQRASLIEAALEQKFGSLLTWERPKIGISIGGNDIDRVAKFEDSLNEAVQTARKTLEDVGNEKLHGIINPKQAHTLDNFEWWQEYLSKEVEKLRSVKLLPIFYGFGHPYFAMDQDYWGQMTEYSLHEALLLSLGIEPERISERFLADLTKDHEKGHVWTAYRYLVRRQDQFRRFFARTGWGYIPRRPAELKRWFEEIDLEVHPGFDAALERRLKKLEPKQARVESSKNLSSQERRTLLSLIAAMSCEGYSYDPTASKNEAVPNIRDDLELVGLSLDPKTVRKWLSEASDLVDENYWKRDA